MIESFIEWLRGWLCRIFGIWCPPTPDPDPSGEAVRGVITSGGPTTKPKA